MIGAVAQVRLQNRNRANPDPGGMRIRPMLLFDEGWCAAEHCSALRERGTGWARIRPGQAGDAPPAGGSMDARREADYPVTSTRTGSSQ